MNELLWEQINRYPHLGKEEEYTAIQASASAAGFVLHALHSNSDVYRELPPSRQAPLRRAVQQIVDQLIQPAFQRELSEEAFKQRTQVALDAFRVVTLGDGGRLQSVIDALPPLPLEDHDGVHLEEAEVRGRLRLQAIYRKLVTDSYTVSELTEQWGISRQRLKQLRDQDRLFAVSVPYRKSMLYPRWQFGADQRPRPIMVNLISEAKNAGLDAIDFHQVMTNPAAGDGTPPFRLLDQGDEEVVIGIIRGADA